MQPQAAISMATYENVSIESFVIEIVYDRECSYCTQELNVSKCTFEIVKPHLCEIVEFADTIDLDTSPALYYVGEFSAGRPAHIVAKKQRCLQVSEIKIHRNFARLRILVVFCFIPTRSTCSAKSTTLWTGDTLLPAKN